MERTKTQFARLLELDRRIRNGEYPNCLTFSEEWEVSQKTVQRDIDFMRDQLGAPILYDRIKKGFYYANPNWFLPSLNITEGDLLALLIGVRAAEMYKGTPLAGKLQDIFQKLAEKLTDKISIKPETVFNKFSFSSYPTRFINEDIWIVIVRGLLSQRLLKIQYRSFESQKNEERIIEPYHMANLMGEWYLFARWPEKGCIICQYSIARIQTVELLEATFEIPPDFNPETILKNTFGRFTGVGNKVHTIKLLFDKEIASWITERKWHPTQKIVTKKNGFVELSFKSAGIYEIFRWVLSWGHYCHVISPLELKRMISDEVKAMSKLLLYRAR